MQTKRSEAVRTNNDAGARPVASADVIRRKTRIQRQWDANQRRWRAILGQIRRRQLFALLLEPASVQPPRRRH